MIPRCRILDPWLCVPVFQRVCLYRTNNDKVPTKRAWIYARLAEDLSLVSHLRQPGCRDRLRSFRPLALRPRFSTGLLLSDLTIPIIARGYRIPLFISVKSPYRNVTGFCNGIVLLKSVSFCIQDCFISCYTWCINPHAKQSSKTTSLLGEIPLWLG